MNKRKLMAAVATAALITGALGTAVALAVNNTGAFELDGNAVTSHTGTAAPDDADRVCYQDAINHGATASAAAAKCFGNGDTATPTGTVNATATTWVDATTNLEIFTGGGSKDPQDPGNDWLWKPKDTIPDKDTITHAFASRYSLTPNPTTCPSSDPTCEVIFFGVDRFDNSGDAQLGFWFFKGPVSTTNTASQGGFKFSGHHQNGDLLVISDFSVGGTTSTISAYFWDTSCTKGVNNPTAGQCAAANLRLQAISTAANCGTSAATSPFCGIANAANGAIAPWSFTDKSGNHSYLQGEYYEAGVNLSNLGIGGECFSSIEAESRSSQSPTATLKDFVLSSFQNCNARAVTTPSASAPVSPGTPVTDHMVITGAGSLTPPFPSSPPNVVFAMCGPISTGICDSTTTARTPTVFGATKALTPTATQGVSEATSDAVNTSSSPLLPGRYCFAGSWAGDTNYPAGASDNSAGECFTVQQIATTTVTTPSDSSGTALTSPLALGTSLYDKAVVTAATSGGGDVTGTVDFFVCNPSQVTGAAGSETCATGGTALTGNPRTLGPIAASNPPASSVLSSPAVVANAAGVWCFRAVYTPTGSVYTGSSDAAHTECVTVGPESTTTVTTPSITTGAVGASVTDHAVVSAADSADSYPSGTINFFICDPATVTANGGDCHTGGTAAGSKAATELTGQLTPSSQATSDAIIASSVGTWCFRAVYVPGAPNGANYTGSHDWSTGECFTITDTTGAVSAQTWMPNDSATITSTGGSALNGTLDIQLYTGGTCGVGSGSAVANQDYNFTITNASSPVTRTTTNSTYTVSGSASVSWLVTFTSSDSNVGSSSHCESTSLTINN